jgi:hypothetical protein
MLEEEQIADSARERRSKREGGPNARHSSPVADSVQLSARDACAPRDLGVGEPPPVCEPGQPVGELNRGAGHCCAYRVCLIDRQGERRGSVADVQNGQLPGCYACGRPFVPGISSHVLTIAGVTYYVAWSEETARRGADSNALRARGRSAQPSRPGSRRVARRPPQDRFRPAGTPSHDGNPNRGRARRRSRGPFRRSLTSVDTPCHPRRPQTGTDARLPGR